MISSHSWWNLYLHFKYFCRSPSKFLRNITIMIFGDPQNFFQRSLSLLMYFLTHAPSIFDTCHPIRLQAVFHLVKKWREEGEECKRQFSKQALEDKGKERLHWLPTVFLKPFNCSYQRDLGLFVYDTSVSIFFCKLTEAVSVWCDQWFNAKGACIAQGQKLKIQSAACIWFLSYKCSFKIFHWKQWQRNLVMSLMVISMTRNNTTCNSFNYTWHTQNSSNQLVRGIFQTLSLLYNWRD